MQSKLTTPLASPVILRKPDVCPAMIWRDRGAHLRAWFDLVSIIGVMTQHWISAEEITGPRTAVEDVYRRLAALYHEIPDYLTNKNQNIMHLPAYIPAVGAPREYWVFGQEKEIGGLKKHSTLSNNRSICWSVLRNVWLLKLIQFHLDPWVYLPRRFNIEGATGASAPVTPRMRGLAEAAGMVLTDNFVDKVDRLVTNYLDVYVGCHVLVGPRTVGQYGLITHLYR